MYLKQTLSAVLALACLLAACGSPAATPEDRQHAVRVVLGLPLDEPDDICELYVECDTQGHVTAVDLTANSLTNLPPGIWQLTHLQSLGLSFNELTSLSPEIGQLTHLRELDLEGNQLTSLPPEIGQLTNLQRLYLANNPLTSLPPELCAKLKDVEVDPPSLCP